MADESVASIIPWHHPETTSARATRVRVTRLDEPPQFEPKPETKPELKPAAKPKSRPKAKPRAKAKAAKAKAAARADDELHASESLIAPDFMEYVEAQAKRPPALAGARLQEPASPSTITMPLPVSAAPVPAPAPMVTAPPAPKIVITETSAARPTASALLLRAAAFALAAVGLTMNGWFAQSLGSTHIAGWLFLAIGVAADLVALVMPTCTARLWQARHHATALAGWAVWLLTFIFAVTAGIGFASTNISEVALARTSRVTPAIAAAQTQLGDAMTARDRECKGGVGKFCREREAAVSERRHTLDMATQQVAQTGDPQTEAAIKLVAWLSHGLLTPQADDFAMLRLVLLALLPQFGGILLMVGRRV